MNVATRDMCIELKNLSQWGETDFCWNGDHLTPAYWPEDMRMKDLDSNPAYDAGYLLRNLPYVYEDKAGVKWILKLENTSETHWMAYYHGEHFVASADTPEDALCQLAIELFKQGVLKSGSDK